MDEAVVGLCASCHVMVGDECPSCGAAPGVFEIIIVRRQAGAAGPSVYRDLALSLADAKARLAQLCQRLDRGGRPENATATLKTFCEHVWLPFVGFTVTSSTLASYRGELERHVYPHLGDIELRRLDSRLLWRWLERLETSGRLDGARGLAPRTVNYIRGIVHRALEHAAELGYLPSNPCPLVIPAARRGSTPSTAPRTRRPRTWTPEQLDRFLAHTADDRLAVAWRLAAICGLGRGEILALRWDDLDLSAGTLSVTRAYVTTNGKRRFLGVRSNARRTLDLDDETLVALHERREREGIERRDAGRAWEEHGLLVCQRNGRPVDPDNFSKAFTRLVDDAGLPPMRLSDLRQLHAARLLEGGTDPDEVARRLGHASGDYTLRSQLDRAADLHLHRRPPPDTSNPPSRNRPF